MIYRKKSAYKGFEFFEVKSFEQYIVLTFYFTSLYIAASYSFSYLDD